MSAVLARAKAHYQGLERKRILVPEWGEGGKPLVVTATALNIAERRRIYRADASGREPDSATVVVRAVLLKACDEKGARLFDDMDEHALTHEADSMVVARIAREILGEAAQPGDATLESAKNG